MGWKSDDVLFELALDRLCKTIAGFVRQHGGPLCCGCVADRNGAQYGATIGDVRVAMARLTATDKFAFGGRCTLCDSEGQRGNPVLRATPDLAAA